MFKMLLGQKKAVIPCFADINTNSAEFQATIVCLQRKWFICCLLIGEVNKLICLKVVSISLQYMASSVKKISLFNYRRGPEIGVQTLKAEMQMEKQRIWSS